MHLTQIRSHEPQRYVLVPEEEAEAGPTFSHGLGGRDMATKAVGLRNAGLVKLSGRLGAEWSRTKLKRRNTAV